MNDRKFFYKYYCAEAAKLVLSNLTVKWSSPILFNDPFDLQVNIDFGFDMDELIEPFLNEVEKLMFSEEDPIGHMDHPLFALIMREPRALLLIIYMDLVKRPRWINAQISSGSRKFHILLPGL